jgi:hypothetical protein
MKKGIIVLAVLSFSGVAHAQYWQQRVEYKMDIDFDVKTHRFTGKQTLKYFNNSPDTLFNVYYHLYFNAFQPGSAMDRRNRTIADPDEKLAKIQKLTPEETGYHKINSLNQNGKALQYHVEGTILEVTLNEPILPGGTAVFDMTFNSQVPAQVRRSGRHNAEGIDYSMSQWFPKMAEYDKTGWHPHPYIGREFYAPWGDYEVNITIDKTFVVAGTGVLQNGNDIGFGYEDEGVKVKPAKEKNTWRFKTENVHDFMWAADPQYVQVKQKTEDGILLRFFYVPGTKTTAWSQLPDYTEKAFKFIQENYGKYPYPEFSVVQGGDGGMEYPMSTLITGHRGLNSLVGVTVHEVMHSWFQGVLATNESYYAWMDEGFTTFATAETMAHLFPSGNTRTQDQNYNTYLQTARQGYIEPLSIHADHFRTNSGYGVGSYYKGAVALGQLRSVMGIENFNKALKRYFNEWKFRHPDMQDFIRVMEKQSGLVLDWYFDYFINTTHYIDYAIKGVEERNGKVNIILKREGVMPMPVDVTVTMKDGTKVTYIIPLDLMRGSRPKENESDIIARDWTWAIPEYTLTLENVKSSDVQKIEIDEKGWIADIDRGNNTWGR